MTETFILTIDRPEDKVRVLEFFQNLGIAFVQKKRRAKVSVRQKPTFVKPERQKALESMRMLSAELSAKYTIPKEVNINQIIDEINAL